LVEIGDLYADKLKDRTQAAKNYVAALEERPEDRRLLTKLMQLYSEEKDWNKLVDVVVKLAEFVEDPAQKVKYLLTAALVSSRQVGNSMQAADFLDQALELDPSNAKALQELIKIQQTTGNFTALEELLRRAIARAEQIDDVSARIDAYEQLSLVYQKHLADPARAAEALEEANALDPGNKTRLDRLAAIYASDVTHFKEKGIQLQEALLAQNPYRQESYKALRKIYTVARDADASWALCQVLSVLKLAEPDETRFYQRMRAQTAAPAQKAFDDEDWYLRVMHPSVDPLLTSIMATIEPAVVQARAQSYEQLGINSEMYVDPSQHSAPLAQTLYYAAGVLGVPLPSVFADREDQGGLSYLYAESPSLLLGRMALSSQVPPQVAAFVAAQKLTYMRPGMYLRHFVQTGTAMKAWLFAAIKATSPQFPVAADLEGPVGENVQALKQHLAGDSKDHLASLVSKLIQSGTSLDLKRWVAGVDLTADRAGFIVAHDLATVFEVIQASEEGSVGVPNTDRLKELAVYAASSKYFEMRRLLNITVES
jgi:tetratricopeptide (TPR) repeat protein